MSGGNKGFVSFTSGKQSTLKMSFGMPVTQRSSGGGHMLNIGRKRVRSEDEYFDDDEPVNDNEYLPAPGSPGQASPAGDSDSDDPLDQFMENIQTEVESLNNKKKTKGRRDDIETEDVQEAYFK